MIVTDSKAAIAELCKWEWVSLDTETTGLHPYLTDKFFSIIVATADDVYYFNYNSEPDHLGATKPYLHFNLDDWVPFFSDTNRTILMHNAKFDWHMLGTHGVQINCRVMCTMAMHRIVDNTLFKYALAALGPIVGAPKSDEVAKYISKHKLYTDIPIEGKKRPNRDMYFNKVPLEVMQPYAEQDANTTFELGCYQIAQIKEIDYRLKTHQEKHGIATVESVAKNEIELTRVLYGMERRGIKIDRPYVQKAYNVARGRAAVAKDNLTGFANGRRFVDSRDFYKPLFDEHKVPFGLTALGNASFSKDSLKDVEHPVTDALFEYRENIKMANTYYRNYLDLADSSDTIHPSFNQGGAKHGRMSCYAPNLQNVKKETVEEGQDDRSYMRRCFIPRDGHTFVMVDYDQMEYRMLLDYAEEMEVIEQVLAGVDVHQATANMMGVTRKHAKTINFMLLYGGGAAKLATALGISIPTAQDLKSLYFEKLPRVRNLIFAIRGAAEKRGYIVNWFGRRVRIANGRAYAAPNMLIAGGCADVVKKAMVDLSAFQLRVGPALQMILQVHDELIFEVDFKYITDAHIRAIKGCMESAYPHKHLPLTVGVEYSSRSWADKKAWQPKTKQDSEVAHISG